MTGTEIIFMYAPLYFVRNMLTFINFIRKSKAGKMDEVTEVTPEMAIEISKKKPLALPLTIIESLWGIFGLFTPFGGIFIAICVNHIIRILIGLKAPREKANRLFSVNSIIHLILTAFLIYKIQIEYALFY